MISRKNLESLNFRFLFFSLLLSLAFSYAFFIFDLSRVDFYLFDIVVAKSLDSKDTSLVHQIVIDEETLKVTKGSPTLNQLNAVLANLIDKNLFIILIDDPETLKAEGNARLVFRNLTKKRLNVYFADSNYEKFKDLSFHVDALQNQNDYFSYLNRELGPVTRDGIAFAKDGVTRRIMLTYSKRPTLHLKLVQLLDHDLTEVKKIRGVFDYLETDQTWIKYRDPKIFKSDRFQDFLEPNAPLAQSISSQIIVIGSKVDTTSKNFSFTPYQREPPSIPIYQIHSQILETLIDNDAPIIASKNYSILITFLTSIFVIYGVLLLKPLVGIALLGCLALGLIVVVTIVFLIFNIWIPLAYPLVGLFVAYYFLIPYRMIAENKKNWELHQKNKLLREVEELKTNFISMISHDLKTPIARIQGLTDNLMKTWPDPESTAGKIAMHGLHTVKSSTQELLHFVNAILNYIKIENQKVELHLEAKDLNRIVEKAVQQNQFLAEEKNVQIDLDLEPLFSIKVDAQVIQQVFCNILENSVKYSDPNTVVQIQSRELPDCIQLKFLNQGRGISADELPNIFMKFFRAKAAKSSTVKGSGLGLYLAKYFVELHHGKIFVASTPGQTTVFTVEIPNSL